MLLLLHQQHHWWRSRKELLLAFPAPLPSPHSTPQLPALLHLRVFLFSSSFNKQETSPQRDTPRLPNTTNLSTNSSNPEDRSRLCTRKLQRENDRSEREERETVRFPLDLRKKWVQQGNSNKQARSQQRQMDLQVSIVRIHKTRGSSIGGLNRYKITSEKESKQEERSTDLLKSPNEERSEKNKTARFLARG